MAKLPSTEFVAPDMGINIMSTRLRWTLLVCFSSVMILVVFISSMSRFGAPHPDRVAHLLLESWKSNPTPPGSAALLTIAPAADLPGYDLSVGKFASGLGIATLHERSHWYSLSWELSFALHQAQENPSVWQLSESRRYRIAGRTILNRRAVLTVITNVP